MTQYQYDLLLYSSIALVVASWVGMLFMPETKEWIRDIKESWKNGSGKE